MNTKHHMLRHLDSLVALLLVPAGTFLALYVRGVSYRDLHLLLMDQDGVLSYLTATHFENSNSFTMSEVAFPDGLSIFAWPSTDYFILALTILFTKLSGSGIIAVNAIFFLGFGAALASSYWVLTRLIGNRAIAIVLATNYAFLPEHWKRQSHLALSMYWVIPLMLYWAILLTRNHVNDKNSSEGEAYPGPWLRKIPLYTCISVFFSVHGTYYSFYFLLVLILATTFTHLTNRKVKPSRNLDLYVAVYLCVLGTIVSITTLLARNAGTDLRIFARNPLESVLYGGQLRTLAMPWGGTELPLVGRPTRQIASLLAVNENEFWQSTIGAISFWYVIMLVAVAIIPRVKVFAGDLEVRLLTFLFFGLTLFFFAGGLGYLVSFIQPQFRAWNRLSFVISFVCLLILGIALERFLRTLHRNNVQRGAMVATALFLIALLITRNDVLPSNLRPYPTWYRSWTAELSDFADELEQKLPSGCGIWQLPEAMFPEVPPVEKLPVYELFGLALFTSDLRYSYGSMKEPQWWLEERPQVPPTMSRLSKLKEEGYCGILVDSRGLSDLDLARVERVLGRELGRKIESDSGRWAFFRLPSG